MSCQGFLQHPRFQFHKHTLVRAVRLLVKLVTALKLLQSYLRVTDRIQQLKDFHMVVQNRPLQAMAVVFARITNW